MSYTSDLRVSSFSVIKLFFILELFISSIICEMPQNLQSDYFMNKKAADLQNWLYEKLSNHEIQIPHTEVPVTDLQENVQQLHQEENLSFNYDNWETSEESGDFYHDDVQDSLVPKDKEKQQIIPTENQPRSNPLPKTKNSDHLDLLHENDRGTHEDQSSSETKEMNNHPVKEILYIRESDSDLTGSLADFLNEALSPKIQTHKPIEEAEPDSDSTGSLADFLNEALSPKIQIHKPIEAAEPDYDSKESISPFAQDELPPDTCSATNHSFYDRQTCSSSPHYKLQPHLSATFAEDLKAQMMEKYSSRQNPDHVVCGFRRRMRPDKDVSQRALCPFHWVVSKRNESRIPEYLFEAKCFCLESCTELKSKINVLWRVGCNDKFHVYREGWEEISVACVPSKPPITRTQTAFVVQLPVPE